MTWSKLGAKEQGPVMISTLRPDGTIESLVVNARIPFGVWGSRWRR
jgi:hypothetical protein